MVTLVASPEGGALDATVVFSHRVPILVQLIVAEVGSTHVLLVPNNGVHAVTSPLSQMSCQVVVAAKGIRMSSHPSTLASNSLFSRSVLPGLGEVRMTGRRFPDVPGRTRHCAGNCD